MQRTTTHCTTLHDTATHYNTLNHTATHCDTNRSPLKTRNCGLSANSANSYTATHCNTATHTHLHWKPATVVCVHIRASTFTHTDQNILSRSLVRALSLANFPSHPPVSISLSFSRALSLALLLSLRLFASLPLAHEHSLSPMQKFILTRKQIQTQTQTQTHNLSLADSFVRFPSRPLSRALSPCLSLAHKRP